MKYLVEIQILFTTNRTAVTPRVNSGDLAMRYSRYGGNGGAMYFRDPSPSHLRYSLDSYKLKNEAKESKKDEPTRWDW